MNSSGIENGNGVFTVESDLSKAIKFWLVLLGQCLSIPCYIFAIQQFLMRRTLYEALHHHVVIVSLLMNFTIISLNVTCHLIFIRLGRIVPATTSLCLIWQFLDYGFWFGDLFLKLWAAIERHILIFHSTLLKNRHRRCLFHYLPLAVFTLYCPLVYVYLIFFYPAVYEYDFSVLLCGSPYYYTGIPAWLIWYESLVHYVVPILLMILFALALPWRVFLQKSRLRLNTGWRQYRRMTIQLLSIAMIYVFDLPYVIVTIVRWSGYPEFGASVQGPYFYYCNYIPTMLFPLATIGSVPSLRQKVSSGFLCNRKRRKNLAAYVDPLASAPTGDKPMGNIIIIIIIICRLCSRDRNESKNNDSKSIRFDTTYIRFGSTRPIFLKSQIDSIRFD